MLELYGDEHDSRIPDRVSVSHLVYFIQSYTISLPISLLEFVNSSSLHFPLSDSKLNG
jgi:hypothetical protein